MAILSVRQPDEKERRAFLFERLRERLQSLARTVSGEFRANVQWSAGTPQTDGRLIQLNPATEYKEAPLLSGKWWVIQKATAAHEAFHVAMTDMNIYRDGIRTLIREAKLPPQMADLVINSAEDARIEYHGKKAWGGIRIWLEYANDLAFRAHEGRLAKASAPEAAATALMLAIIVGRLPKGTPANVESAIVALQPLIEQIRKAKDTATAMRFALDLARSLPPIFRQAPPNPPVRLLGTPIAVSLPSGADDEEPSDTESGDPGEDHGSGKTSAADPDDGDGSPSDLEEGDAADGAGAEDDEDAADQEDPVEGDDNTGDHDGDQGDSADEADDEPIPFEDEPESQPESQPEEPEPDGAADDGADGEGDDGREGPGPADEDGDPKEEPEDDSEQADDGSGARDGDTDETEGDGAAGADGKQEGDDAADDDDAAGDDDPAEDLDETAAAATRDIEAEFAQLLEEAGAELESADADALDDARSRPLSPEELAAHGDGLLRFEEQPVRPTGEQWQKYGKVLYETTALRERFFRQLQQTLRPPRPEPHTGSKRGRLDVHRAWRAPALGDLAVFSHKTLQPSLKGVAVYLLIDNSGSMMGPARSGTGERSVEPKIAIARRAAVVVCDALQRVGVPHTAVGYTHLSSLVTHRRFVRWDDQTPEGQAGLGAIDAGSDNCDGYSIRMATAELLHRREETKILLVLSDGLPVVTSQRHLEPVEDTLLAVREAMRHGVLLAGLYFGNDDAKSIASARRMYPDLACLFGDISHLPEVVGQTVVRLLRRAAVYG